MTFLWICFVLHLLASIGLLFYGLNNYILIWEFLRGKNRNSDRLEKIRTSFWRHIDKKGFPPITVQLPIYNERYVVERLIKAVANFDYPKEKLEIQILDDSTDDTTKIVRELVLRYRADSVNIMHIRRRERIGFKAGALREGLKSAYGELIAIFDADFAPTPDFLKNVLPYFDDQKVGVVQTRWGHINESYSLLTKTQSIAIDGHFGIEQPARCQSGLLLNFNGTAGVWRRKTIDDAGGWHADTLTEDLDLSYRAQLRGWRIEYLSDVVAPCEIPPSMMSFKSQQRRWAKGSMQTALKLIPKVFRAPLSLFTKLEALLHLTYYMVHPFMLTVAILALPLLFFWESSKIPTTLVLIFMPLILLSLCGPLTLYILSQWALGKNWLKSITKIPVLLCLGMGISLNSTKAVLEAFLGIKSGFVRTPKWNIANRSNGSLHKAYRLPLDFITLLELIMTSYCAFAFYLCVETANLWNGVFLFFFACGHGVVSIGSMVEHFSRGKNIGIVNETLVNPFRKDALVKTDNVNNLG